MKKWLGGLLCIILIGGIAFSLGKCESVSTLPTTTLEPTNTVTNTATITPTSTVTFTITPSTTYTPTSTVTPTNTSTLATLILYITAEDRQSTPIPTARPTSTATVAPPSTYAVPSPPAQIATASTAASGTGWIRYEADDPAIEYTIGRWLSQQSPRASNGSYKYSADRDAVAVLPFEGAGLRVRFVAYSLFGIFEVRVDGQVLAVVDSYRTRAEFMTTDVFGLVQGKHTLEIVDTRRKNAASGGYIIALDAIEIYRGVSPTNTPTPSPTPTATFTPSPAPVREIKLISAPPTIAPTNTPPAPRLVSASLVIAYDENGNHVADPAEGVRGISVRLVTVGTNQVIASSFTNSEGFARLEALSDTPVRLVVPYFGKFWDISSSGAEPRFSLILPPGNQPGLIP